MKTIDFMTQNYDTILAVAGIVYELAARIWPTSKNISIIDNVIKVFAKIVPNRSKKTTKIVDAVNTVNDSVSLSNNHIIKMIIFFMLCSLGSFAQLNTNVKSLNSYNTDSTTVRSNSTQLQIAYGNQIGTLYYNKQSHKWRVFQDSVWYDLLNLNAGTSNFTNTAANNELIKSDGTNGIPSGFFSSVLGNLDLGSASISGSSRTIKIVSSATDLNLNLIPKGNGGVFIQNPANATQGFVFNPSNGLENTVGNLQLQLKPETNITANGNPTGLFGGQTALVGGTGGILTLGGGTALLEADYGLTRIQSNSIDLGLLSHNTIDDVFVKAQIGTPSANSGMNLNLSGGDAYTISGNGNGGAVNITGGTPNGAGSQGSVNITGNDVLLSASGNAQLAGGTSNILVAGTASTLQSDSFTFVDIAGTLQSTIKNFLTGTATLNFPSTLATAVADLTITVTGASTTSTVFLGVPNAAITATASYYAWVSAANTVTVRFSPKAVEDPASASFRVTVFNY